MCAKTEAILRGRREHTRHACALPERMASSQGVGVARALPLDLWRQSGTRVPMPLRMSGQLRDPVNQSPLDPADHPDPEEEEEEEEEEAEEENGMANRGVTRRTSPPLGGVQVQCLNGAPFHECMANTLSKDARSCPKLRGHKLGLFHSDGGQMPHSCAHTLLEEGGRGQRRPRPPLRPPAAAVAEAAITTTTATRSTAASVRHWESCGRILSSCELLQSEPNFFPRSPLPTQQRPDKSGLRLR